MTYNHNYELQSVNGISGLSAFSEELIWHIISLDNTFIDYYNGETIEP